MVHQDEKLKTRQLNVDKASKRLFERFPKSDVHVVSLAGATRFLVTDKISGVVRWRDFLNSTLASAEFAEEFMAMLNFGWEIGYHTELAE